jgi:hypothetical protein
MLKHIGFTRNDLLLIAVLLLFAAVGVWRSVTGAVNSVNAVSAVIRVNGEVQAVLPLDKDSETTVTGYNGGVNIIVIRSRTIYVREADCPDLLCVKHKPISDSGEFIVCLPHRVSVTLE